ncbi:MAG: hypothetical protein ACYDCK_13185 [Thermoplasmatota archaeon]
MFARLGPAVLVALLLGLPLAAPAALPVGVAAQPPTLAKDYGFATALGTPDPCVAAILVSSIALGTSALVDLASPASAPNPAAACGRYTAPVMGEIDVAVVAGGHARACATTWIGNVGLTCHNRDFVQAHVVGDRLAFVHTLDCSMACIAFDSVVELAPTAAEPSGAPKDVSFLEVM